MASSLFIEHNRKHCTREFLNSFYFILLLLFQELLHFQESAAQKLSLYIIHYECCAVNKNIASENISELYFVFVHILYFPLLDDVFLPREDIEVGFFFLSFHFVIFLLCLL